MKRLLILMLICLSMNSCATLCVDLFGADTSDKNYSGLKSPEEVATWVYMHIQYRPYMKPIADADSPQVVLARGWGNCVDVSRLCQYILAKNCGLESRIIGVQVGKKLHAVVETERFDIVDGTSGDSYLGLPDRWEVVEE